MTEVADSTKQVGQGLTQKTFNYEPLDSLVDIVTNAAGKLSFQRIFTSLLMICVGQVVSAVVQKKNGNGGGGSGGSASPTATPSATPMPVSLPVSSATNDS
jgi:hypothetical protein